jgi:hypothetical protein
MIKMISKDIQEKLLGIIKKEMIPEYKNLSLYKTKLKDEYVRYLEKDCLREEDYDLIYKYPDHIKKVSQVPIAYYYRYGRSEGLELEHFSGYWARDNDDLVIDLGREYPSVSDTIYSLKEKDKKEWKKIGPLLHQYVNSRNSYIKKINLAYEFLSHKNTTITLIKKEFPELYKLYKS